MRLFYDEKTLTGVTVEDRSKVEVISAKVSGRIDRLYFQNTGEKLQAGDKLYDLYSEDLLAAIKDYLLTIDKQEGAAKTFNFSPFILAAKNKLILWGLSERQIEKLSLRDVKNTIPIYSKVSGVLSTIAVKEGDTIEEGTELFQLSDFNTIWVEAQTYAQDFQNKGDQKEAEVVIAAYPEIVYKGNNLFINPEFAGNSKINLIRIKIENTGGKVKPGMMAYIQFRTRGASILAVPSEAVLRNEKSATVWVKNNKGNFEVRMVTIGAENKKYVEIISGLKEGEILVTSGAYLLNSEYILKKGADPMAGMKM
jgi:Cu(I)/Ag(I) efflux system membrane fusion protein